MSLSLLFVRGHAQLGSQWKVIDLTVCTTLSSVQTGPVQNKDSPVTLNIQPTEYVLSNHSRKRSSPSIIS